MAIFEPTPKFRITEIGDTRITEEGDTRVVSPPNAGIGALHAEGTLTSYALLIKFAIGDRVTEEGDIRVTEEGNTRTLMVTRPDTNPWVAPTVKVRYDGQWVTPLKGYVKDNGIWKRIY